MHPRFAPAWLPKKRDAGEQSRLMDKIIASKKPVVDMDDIVKQYNLLNITFKKNGSVASYTVNEQKKDTML